MVKAVCDTTHLTVPLALVIGLDVFLSIRPIPAYFDGYVLKKQLRPSDNDIRRFLTTCMLLRR